jgi:hypothetical protein
MKRLIRHLTISLIFAAGLFSFSCRKNPVAPQPPFSSDTSSHNFSWLFDTLGSYPAFFNDVWGASTNNVYAVGFVNAPTGQPANYMAHFDGFAWHVISDTALLYGLGAGGLSGIHGLSKDDITVVGISNQGNGLSGFIGRWDGLHWKNVTPTAIRPFHTVWMRGDHDIFAGGGNGYVVHYNGVEWDSLPSGTTLDVWRIFGLPTGEVYGVASNYWQSPQGSVILRIDSSRVTTEQIISGRRLFAFWGDSRTNLYAVGEGVFHKGPEGGWQDLGVQRPATSLFGIGAMKGSDILIGGYLQTILHWNGVSWKFYDSLYVPTGTTSINQIRAIGDEFFCVGDAGSLAFTMHSKHQ